MGGLGYIGMWQLLPPSDLTTFYRTGVLLLGLLYLSHTESWPRHLAPNRPQPSHPMGIGLRLSAVADRFGRRHNLPRDRRQPRKTPQALARTGKHLANPVGHLG